MDGRGTASNLHLQRVKPAYEQVADQLRAQIIDGRLRAGDRLPPESDLLSTFGVSRSTLREALRGLAARDLVHTTRGVTGGTFVSKADPLAVQAYLSTSLSLMSGDETISVGEMVEAREVVEVPAARLAAERATAAEVELLREVAAREVSGGDEAYRFGDHRQFHSLVVELAGNRLLSLMNEPNFDILSARFRRSDLPADWWARVDADHVEITEHIAAGNSEDAGHAMQAHLERLRDLYRPADPPA